MCGVLCAVSLLSCRGGGDAAPEETMEVDTIEVCDTQPRTSITFIMGKDDSPYNQYYTLANYYYRLNPDDRTEVVVENLTALSQVLDYLRQHPTPDGRPYGLINLVSHGNEFVDLQMTVTPKGSRTSAASLFDALLDGTIVPLDDTAVDSLTTIYLHGCAVGNNQGLLNLLAQVFGGRATVKASKLFEYYAYMSESRNPQSVHHYFAKTWYAFHHPDSAMDEDELVRQLKQRYPTDTICWREGLRRRLQDNPSQLYHFSFTIPCTYEEVFDSPGQMPLVNSVQKRQQWIAGHDDFRQLLESTHVPMKYFRLKYYRQTFLLDDDQLAMGLKVKARADVICLLQPLTDRDGMMPLRPDDSDSAIFAFSQYRYASVPGPCSFDLDERVSAETFLCQKKDVSL